MKIEKILGYDVHRKKVKNMNLRINQNMEVYISAPLNLHSSYIENFIRSKEGWIKKVLNKIEDVKLQHKEYEYTTGEIHKLVGKEYFLKVRMGNINRVSLNRETNEILLVTDSENVENKKKIMDKWYFECAKKLFPDVMDKWLLSKLNTLIGEVDEYLNTYRITEAARTLQVFTDNLSNWYVRRCRERYWAKGMEKDKVAAYMTLYTALVNLSKIAAPFIPFMTEQIYQNMVRIMFVLE